MNKDKGRCLAHIVFGCILLFGIVAAISYFWLGTPFPIHYFDHGRAPNVTDASRWDSTNGLSLSVVNALDDSWQDIFYEYVAKWDLSDALELTTRQVTADSACDPILGELKVCNGDYGETDWKGINLNLIRDGFIVQGTSQMNDYFLAHATTAERKYTMCHEVGHGFGLPHTDENYENQNRGDCLDYTNRPNTNLEPGQFNYDLLVQLYGTFPPQRRLLEGDSIPQDIIEKFISMSKQMADPSHHCKERDCMEDIGGGYHVLAHKLLVHD